MHILLKKMELFGCAVNNTGYGSSPAGGVTVPTKMDLENVVYAD